jgi:hypothetical protein
MSANRMQIDGLAELYAELRRLPSELTGEAKGIVEGAANGAAAEIRAAYPVRATNLQPGPRRRTKFFPPGNLRARVIVSILGGKGLAARFGVNVVVKNTAPHAWLFERGTQTRQNALGANRGAMPLGNVFVPIVIRRRRAMYADLKALVVRHGLTVVDA